ncbi:MAG: WYL domain-containing protein [Corynebacterium sp.]|uniref:helix-turn-helix transcriptional regulator n=1 Tax=Corynebacterium sp. TaxID=1720 RepID=UPI0026DD3BDA|nr:WYL domain-containing protein [Corynebacterium sp.]MDO5029036.1 WYL domain-containing protein [Corynebacterium sp.]
MSVHSARELEADISVDELLAIVPYFADYRSMTEAATELDIPFARIRSIVSQLEEIDQPGLLGVRAFAVDYRGSFDVRITPKVGTLSQPRALSGEETATLLLILETIEDTGDAESSRAAQSAALKLRRALGTSVPVIDSDAADDGKSFALSEEIYAALHQRKVLKVRYRKSSGEITVRELDCVNVFTVESVTYLRAVDRADDIAIQKSFRVDRIVDAEVLDIPAAFHRPVPVDIRDPHAFGTDGGASEWASVLIDADATWIADYEPVFFTENADHPSEAGEFTAEVPMSNVAATASFVLRRSPNVRVIAPKELKKAVVARASEALAEYGLNDKT